MHLSKGEYSQFTLQGKYRLLCEFGLPLKEIFRNRTRVVVYLLYGFYVEVVYENEMLTTADPVKFNMLLDHYS